VNQFEVLSTVSIVSKVIILQREILILGAKFNTQTRDLLGGPFLIRFIAWIIKPEYVNS